MYCSNKELTHLCTESYQKLLAIAPGILEQNQSYVGLDRLGAQFLSILIQSSSQGFG